MLTDWCCYLSDVAVAQEYQGSDSGTAWRQFILGY